MEEVVPPAEVVEQLAAFYRRNGYTRRPTWDGLAPRPWGYSTTFQVRLVANTTEELETIRDLLRRAGFTPGRPFAKGRQWRQPIYGRAVVERFLGMIGSSPEAVTK